ncbi:hypothetical protein BGZ54_007592, partial [Gamsiella multidivaricata]
LKANIITRGARSLGYGFVAYETLAQAEQAATTHNKTNLGGREINVEVAKPRVERLPKEKTPKQPKSAKTKDVAAAGTGESWGNADATATGDGWGSTDVADVGDAAVKPRTGRNNRSRANRKNRNRVKNEGEEGTFEETAAAAPASANGETKEGSGRRKRSNRRHSRKEGNGDAAEGGAGTSAPWTPRPVGPPSKTTVFVANLPFAMEDDGLKALFADFKVASAHVVRRHGSGRSKGFGFVELVDEAEQQNVLEKMKDAQADGRDLVIKVALSEEQTSSEAGEVKSTEVTA